MQKAKQLQVMAVRIITTDQQAFQQMMKESVGDEFTLSYSEEKKSTTILKGYFQDK